MLQETIGQLRAIAACIQPGKEIGAVRGAHHICPLPPECSGIAGLLQRIPIRGGRRHRREMIEGQSGNLARLERCGQLIQGSTG